MRFSAVVDTWNELNTKQQEQVVRYMNTLLAQQTSFIPEQTKSGREVVRVKKERGVTYQQEMVKCGKKSCTKCPHGPYWYAYGRTRLGGKITSQYIGKELKPPKKSYVTDARRSD